VVGILTCAKSLFCSAIKKRTLSALIPAEELQAPHRFSAESTASSIDEVLVDAIGIPFHFELMY
jgi:hypothetical protein